MGAPFPMSEHLPNFESFHLPLLPPDHLPEVAAALPAAPVPCKAWPWPPAPRGSLLAWAMWLPPLSHTLPHQQNTNLSRGYHSSDSKTQTSLCQHRAIPIPWLSPPCPGGHQHPTPPPVAHPALSPSWGTLSPLQQGQGSPLAPPKAAKDQAGRREGRAEVALRWQEEEVTAWVARREQGGVPRRALLALTMLSQCPCPGRAARGCCHRGPGAIPEHSAFAFLLSDDFSFPPTTSSFYTLWGWGRQRRLCCQGTEGWPCPGCPHLCWGWLRDRMLGRAWQGCSEPW